MSRPRAAQHREVPRRTLLRAGALASVAALGTAGCSSRFAATRLTLATGGSEGVYYMLGEVLAGAWQSSLGLAERPTVLATSGSVDNLTLLDNGTADVIFSTADNADAQLNQPSRPGRAPRALARLYDDALQVVVPAHSPITTIAALRGKRVSIGAADSGVTVMANHLLDLAGMSAQTDLSASRLGINDSTDALRAGRVDAFFWSGGVPTGGLVTLAATLPIRLLDLAPLTTKLRDQDSVYDVGTVPAGTYGIPDAITTMLVRNYLLVPESMSDDLAKALVTGLFAASQLLIRANPEGRTIDLRSAIGTEPVRLHPGALRYYRQAKVYY